MPVTVIGFDKDKRKRTSCKHCLAILEYEPRDVQSQHGTDIGGGPDGSEFITCPECKHRVVLRTW